MTNAPYMKLAEELMSQCPNGDPLYMEITAEEMFLYNAKNGDYAGGGEDPNGNFNRTAKIYENYPNLRMSDPRMVALNLFIKQLDQILWSLNRGFEGKVEGLDARLADLHVYAKIARVINRHMMDEPNEALKTAAKEYHEVVSDS